MDHVKNRATAVRKVEAVGLKFAAHIATPMSLAEAKVLLGLLRNAWSRVEDSHALAVGKCTTEAATEAQDVIYEAAFDRYCQIELQATVIIRDLEIAASAAAPAAAIPAVPNVRLRSMELPSFDGALHEWTSFKDLFLATVGNSLQLTGAQKLQYLKTSLRGKAAEQISTLAITDAHYTEAWNILCNKYENTREIVHSLIRRIIDFKALNRENAADKQGLMDNALKCLRALKVIGRPVADWDDILIVILTSKLDSSTRREWAIRQTGKDLPTMKQFEDFLHGHVRGLLAAGSNLAAPQQPFPKARFEKGVRVHHSATDTSACPVCTKPHTVHSCRELQSKSPAERSTIIRRIQLCINCLSASHRFKECPSSGSCRQCGQRHHTLLHVSRPSGVSENNGAFASKSNTSRGSSASQPKPDSPPTVGSHHASGDEGGLLMTAVVEVKDKLGRSHQCRVFLDSGSQSDFVTTSFVRRLELPRKPCNIGIGGIGGVAAGRSKGKVTVKLVSRYNPQSTLEVNLLVLDKLTDFLPNVRCKKESWRHLSGLQLADPQWHHPAPVDILLGVKHEAYIKLEKKILGSSPSEPAAWETIFGWAISGACPADNPTVKTFHISTDIVDTFIRKFWEIEEPPKKKILTAQEKKCEEHFQRTHTRDFKGRFVVRIPFNEKKKHLGNSRMIAINRFKQVERRLLKQPLFQKQYVSFMREYEALGHMVKIPPANIYSSNSLYLCHHGVMNENSSTTKLRVVFDGSAATSTGVSLNDAMLVGASLQDDLVDILLRFRIHKVVLKGDIAKMFRQFRLGDEDADYHRIIWRESPEDQLQDFRLTTVTYGTACAPNLATRCLQQLAQDVGEQYPRASKTLHEDAYVDDILTGGDNEEEVMEIYKELVSSVATAGMELRKWSSNSPSILNAIPKEFRETDPVNFDIDDQLIKALGIQWNPSMDTFTFKPINFQMQSTLTKRILYSELARVFDPLGFISCVTVRGKLLLQTLWTLQIGWDEEVPESIRLQWMEYKDDLELLSSVHLPRQLCLSPEFTELHCFSDSSERAYGSILYVRSVFPNGTITVTFITSKAKVAPLKQVSLPRMELNAAKGGAELATHVREVLLPSIKVASNNVTPLDLIMWTDSTITLKWITGEPRRWKTYVANRVAAIQEITSKDCWRHVSGQDNPADLASRGIPLSELGQFWWNGPKWLQQPTLPNSSIPTSSTTVDEEEREVVTCHAGLIADDWMERHSSLRFLKRVAVLLHKFLFRQRKAQGSMKRVSTSGPTSVKSLSFTPSDLSNGLHLLIKFTQHRYFYTEIERLKKKNEVQPSSCLKSLYPYIDNEGILRVSGRLQRTSIAEERKHLIILPGEAHFTTLLVRDTHHQHHHAGFQFTWGQLGLEFWIVRGRDRVRHILRSCVICRRHRAKAATQLMGQLPACRATPSRPFLNSGVDYAGPFSLKSQSGRGWKVAKSWLCLFVCMASKAIHLELVDSLSTDSFLAAFRRFSSRRGIPAHIFSDCGSNFIKAEKELQQYLLEEETNAIIANTLSERGITWHFLPPNAPHQGGLWEAGVKSAKHHLRRVMGELTMTKECFSTLLCEIEAILNSRPLYQQSTDPADMEPLTPGHLLIGEPLTAVPSPSLLEIPQNRMSQYQLVVNRVQDFWRRWSREYLNTMQQRTKWMWQKDNVKLNDLVLLMEDTPPTLWRMGRVEAIHPGEDGLVRSVTVKTATNKLKRPIVKLVPLVSAVSVLLVWDVVYHSYPMVSEGALGSTSQGPVVEFDSLMNLSVQRRGHTCTTGVRDAVSSTRGSSVSLLEATPPIIPSSSWTSLLVNRY